MFLKVLVIIIFEKLKTLDKPSSFWFLIKWKHCAYFEMIYMVGLDLKIRNPKFGFYFLEFSMGNWKLNALLGFGECRAKKLSFFFLVLVWLSKCGGIWLLQLISVLQLHERGDENKRGSDFAGMFRINVLKQLQNENELYANYLLQFCLLWSLDYYCKQFPVLKCYVSMLLP